MDRPRTLHNLSRGRSCAWSWRQNQNSNERKVMNDKFDQEAKDLTQCVSRRATVKRFCPKMPHFVAIALMLAGVHRVLADEVTDWNQIALATQAAVPGAIRTPPAARALAMVHLAILDSVNAIERRFTRYAVEALA